MLRGCVAAAAILAEFGSPAMAAEDFTTTDRTIQDRDDDRLLELGPGEKVMLRQDFAAARPGRVERRRVASTGTVISSGGVANQASISR